MNIFQSMVWLAISYLILMSQHVRAEQIVIGQVAPLSGLDANQGRAHVAGMQLYFNSVNTGRGINGHTFMLVHKDDGGRPNDTVSLTRQLLAEDKPMVLSGYFGSRNISDLVASGILEKEQIALVGYRTSEIRNESLFLYSVRAGLRDEINKIVDHLGTIGITRLGLFYEDTAASDVLINAVEVAAKRSKASLIVKASYPNGTVRVSSAVNIFISTPPQAIIIVSSGAAAAGFIEQYRTFNGTAQLFAHSNADIEQLSKRLAEEQMQGVAIAQVTPNPYKINGRLTKDFVDAVTKSKNLEMPISYAMLEGYIAAKVIVEAIRRQGAKPSRKGTISALDSMNSFDVGGYVLSFSPGLKTGSKLVEMSIISRS